MRTPGSRPSSGPGRCGSSRSGRSSPAVTGHPSGRTGVAGPCGVDEAADREVHDRNLRGARRRSRGRPLRRARGPAPRTSSRSRTRAPGRSRGERRRADARGRTGPGPRRIARRSQITGRSGARPTGDHRIAHSSPRRTPIVMATHSSAPHARSRHATPTIRAASAVVRGSGSGFGIAVGSAWPIGPTETHRRRTARLNPPERMKCMCRTVVGLNGRHRCGPHRSSHSCRPAVR